MLRRSEQAEAYAHVGRKLAACDGSLEERILRAVVLADSPLGLEVLCTLVGEDRERNLRLLAAISDMEASPRNGDAADCLRPLLDSEDPEILVAVISVLAALGEDSVAEKLVELMALEDRTVREAAHDALCRLAMVDLPANGEAWRKWLGGERKWWKEQGQHSVQDLWGSDRRKILDAIFESTRHPLFRISCAGRLEVLGGSPDPLVREAAARARRTLMLVKPPAAEKPGQSARTGVPAVAAAPAPRPSPRRKPPLDPGGGGNFYLLVFGIPVCLGLAVLVGKRSLIERFRRRTEGPMSITLKGRGDQKAADVSPEELFYRSKRPKSD
jgi:hypothetical protein